MNSNVSAIVIIEKNFPEVPHELLRQEFGYEALVDNVGHMLAEGTSVLLSGDEEAIKTYLRSCGTAVWSTDNPMMGNWSKYEVKA